MIRSDIYTSAITRFTPETWKENINWCDRQGARLYNVPSPIPPSIGTIPYIFMIEMNITDNRIIGVGMIKNKLNLKKRKDKVYSKQQYNLYSYYCKSRLSREEFNEDEERSLETLEQFLFKGYSHMKRGIGISKLPNTLVYKTSVGKNGDDDVKKLKEQLLVLNATKVFVEAFGRMGILLPNATLRKDDTI